MDEILQERLHQLSDLDLAVLVSHTAALHCLVWSESHVLNDLRRELQVTCQETFGLQTAVVNCSPTSTVDELSEAILVNYDDSLEDASEQRESEGKSTLSVNRLSSRGHSPGRFGSNANILDDRRIADVIITNDLDLAPANVQVQILELLRTKRIFTRTAMHTAPKDLLLIAVASKPGARLMHHLNDMFGMSHYHGDEDSLPHVEGKVERFALPSFSREELTSLRSRAEAVRLTGEIDAYLHDIVVFMRQSRYVKGGITATATRDLRAVAKALAPLHGLDFVPPSLVALAARKVYPHRMIMATAQTERTLQWGSDPDAVREMLTGLTTEDVIEDVLGSVDVPL